MDSGRWHQDQNWWWKDSQEFDLIVFRTLLLVYFQPKSIKNTTQIWKTKRCPSVPYFTYVEPNYKLNHAQWPIQYIFASSVLSSPHSTKMSLESPPPKQWPLSPTSSIQDNSNHFSFPQHQHKAFFIGITFSYCNWNEIISDYGNVFFHIQQKQHKLTNQFWGEMPWTMQWQQIKKERSAYQCWL